MAPATRRRPWGRDLCRDDTACDGRKSGFFDFLLFFPQVVRTEALGAAFYLCGDVCMGAGDTVPAFLWPGR